MEGIKSGYLTPRTGVFFCLVLTEQVEHILRHHPQRTIELHIPVDTPA
ncbi:TPA: hypothetical protein OUD90_001891 [Citrobacter braakii]|nr:hypothetical protein [Citrobacter braakii]